MMMFDYPRMTTKELIDLLFNEEDRVTRQHIDELVGRGEEAAAPLREILKNEDNWYEGQNSDYWILVHAIVILSAMRDDRAFPILIEMVPHAFFSNHDDVVEVLPASLAQFGEEAIEPYMKFISEHRGAFHDNPDYSFCREVFSAALTRIGLEHETRRAQVTDFICGKFTDPQEDDVDFLSYSAGHPVALDRERGMNALLAASERGRISKEATGKFKDFVKSLDYPNARAYGDLRSDLFEFYRPEEIRERQRERAEMREEKLYWGVGDRSVPAGYATTLEGNIVRAERVGRNDPCPCGSGKKYKKCCGVAN